MTRGRKPQIKDQVRGLCVNCNLNQQACGPPSKNGYLRYLPTCNKCTKQKYKLGKYSSVYKNKKPHCEKCGFIALDRCQLDIHHIDRNHKNNEVNNVITLCANCHRFEHKDEREQWGRGA